MTSTLLKGRVPVAWEGKASCPCVYDYDDDLGILCSEDNIVQMWVPEGWDANQTTSGPAGASSGYDRCRPDSLS
jgi:hypothetical protein